MSEPAVAGLVLAAGGARRMGRDKRLLRLEGETLLRRCVREASGAGLDPVLVVLDPDPGPAADELAGTGAAAVANPAPERGMNGSLALGIARLRASPACAVLLPDMPRVDAAMLRALVARWRDQGAALVLSRYGEVLAPPTLFDRDLFDELAAGGPGDGRGREVARRHRDRAGIVDWPPDRLADVDTPADWEALSRKRR